MKRTNLLLFAMACLVILHLVSCDTSQEIQSPQGSENYPHQGVEIVAVRNDENVVTGYYFRNEPETIITKARTEAHRITNRADVIRNRVGDMDNFGFGGNDIPPCIFYDLSDPIVDLGIFDRELGFSNEVQTWVHDFREDPALCEEVRIDSVIVEIREFYSQDQSSTITIDGITLPFVSEPSFCNEPVIRTFVFTGESASFAGDGLITITFSENGDDIALDWSAVYVVSNCDPVIIVDTDSDGIQDEQDNCPDVPNSGQENNDGDAAGDVCDDDDDNDGIADSQDNCPLTSNTDQNDFDFDLQGDACDTDDDNDGIADSQDNCPLFANIGQQNYDGDASGDACDPDDDNDGVNDGNDVHPNSNRDATINLDGCNSGVENKLLSGGSTMMDMILDCRANASNHGKFKSCVTQLLNAWTSEGFITSVEKDAIRSCL